VAEEG